MTGEHNTEKQLRLLIVAPQYRKNNERFLRCLNDDLRLQTSVVWIRDFRGDDQPSEQFISQLDYDTVGAKNIRVGDYTSANFVRLFRLLRKRIGQCDAVLTSTQCPVHSKVAYALAKWYRKKLFVVVQQWSQSSRRGMLGRAYERLGYHILRHSDRVFVHGTCQERFVLAKGVLAERVARLPFLSDDLAEVAIRDPQLKMKLGLGGKRVILYFGRIMAQKGLEDLIRAFPKIREAVKDVRLLVCGSGHDSDVELSLGYEDRCRKLAIQVAGDEIVFTGAIDPHKKQDYFAAADLFVHPHCTFEDRREGWGLVVNEATSMGLPVVATDRVPSAYDLVQDGVNGYVVESGNVNALEERISEILLDQKKLKSFSDNSRTIFEEYHQEHLIADRILEAAGVH